MAEAIGVAISALSLASVFSSCVECFGYFSASKEFERDRNILLVRLDFERNKLLIWGNSVGVLREPGDGLLKALGRSKETQQKSRKQLECIISLLTDAEKLQETYGVRGLETRGNGPISWSLVSKNNLDLFKLTLKRFLLRNPSEAADYRKCRVWAKLKWAIHDKQKFQGLINDLKELVDQLFLIQYNSKLLISLEQLDAHMKTDIELIDNVEQLSFVQEACEDSYRTWSDHAASIIAASENGTIDRRNFEEISRDVDGQDSRITARSPGVEKEDSGNDPLLIGFTKKKFDIPTVLLPIVAYDEVVNKVHIILTDECPLYSEKKTCNASSDLCTDAIFEQSFIVSNNGESQWQKAASPVHIFTPEISRLLRLTLENEKGSKSTRLRELLLAENINDNQRHYLNIFLPLVRIQIYTPPCSCLLMTAIEMCSDLQTRYVQATIRPDHRLRSTCCSGQNGLQRMREIADRIRGAHGYEPQGYDVDCLYQLENIDLAWIEKRIFTQDEEPTKQPFSSTNERFRFEYGDSKYDILILLGEAAVLGPEMIKRPFKRRARVPKQSEVYSLARIWAGRSEDTTHTWRFSGRFTSQSTYQWSSLDPALVSIQESSPPPPTTTD